MRGNLRCRSRQARLDRYARVYGETGGRHARGVAYPFRYESTMNLMERAQPAAKNEHINACRVSESVICSCAALPPMMVPVMRALGGMGPSDGAGTGRTGSAHMSAQRILKPFGPAGTAISTACGCSSCGGSKATQGSASPSALNLV